MPRSHKKRRRRAPGHQGRQRFSIRNWPDGPPPAEGTVCAWLRNAEAEGMVERTGAEHTGKPGRPSVLWGLTAEGKQRAGGGAP